MMKSVLIILVFLFSGQTVLRANPEFPDTTDNCVEQHMLMIDSVINYAKNYIGVPYKYGGKNDNGFDCSGFMHYIFEPFGLNLPYSSRAYGELGKEIDAKEARKGDFALFKGRNASSTGIGHVALVVDVDENGWIFIIHATIHKGITIDNMSVQDYYIKRYINIRRLSPPCEVTTTEEALQETE